MLAIVGTVPDERFPLTIGRMSLIENTVRISEKNIPVNRGTPALIGAAIKAGEVLGLEDIHGFLAGDIGLGHGSRELYRHLTEHLPEMGMETLVFHYLQPDVDWHNKILFAVDAMEKKPVLIADAGFMYAAKMSGQARCYDMFTPDVGELAFLADEIAPHPFYTRGFILHEDNQVPDLIRRAYDHGNAANYLLVKGCVDYVVNEGQILTSVDKPVAEAMEAMGGTGDTLTGIVAALVASGMSIPEAGEIAARTNRLAGFFARPTPATQVMEIIRQIPRALTEVLKSPHMKDAYK